MFKTFLFGILLGLAAAAGTLYAVPAVDQHRESSLITVAPNGGNIESFHINIPMDRVMIGAQTDGEPLPRGMVWPDDEQFKDVRAEIFKIRNARDAVVGVAARTTTTLAGDGAIEWTVHLPARGSMFVSIDPKVTDAGVRRGQLRAGSREFKSLVGNLTERWIENKSLDEDAPLGRIELLTTYVSTAEVNE